MAIFTLLTFLSAMTALRGASAKPNRPVIVHVTPTTDISETITGDFIDDEGLVPTTTTADSFETQLINDDGTVGSNSNYKQVKYYCSTFQVDTNANYFTIQASNSDVTYNKGEALYLLEVFNNDLTNKKTILNLDQEGENMYQFYLEELIDIMNKPGHVYSTSYLSLRFWNCIPCPVIHKIVCSGQCNK